jgi:hypothetical protein
VRNEEERKLSKVGKEFAEVSIRLISSEVEKKNANKAVGVLLAQ